jgi:hypothetical protein
MEQDTPQGLDLPDAAIAIGDFPGLSAFARIAIDDFMVLANSLVVKDRPKDALYLARRVFDDYGSMVNVRAHLRCGRGKFFFLPSKKCVFLRKLCVFGSEICNFPDLIDAKKVDDSFTYSLKNSEIIALAVSFFRGGRGCRCNMQIRD